METTLEPQVSEDRALMVDLVHHRPAALNRLYKRYSSMLKAIIMQVIHDETEAEDVLQDVFIQVWDRAQNYSAEKGHLGSWLATLARRRAIDRVRQHSAYRRATDRYEVLCNHPDKEVSECHTVEAEANRDDLRDILLRHVGTLPPAQKEAICMAFFESKSQREISALTGTPLGTVKTRIELGIRKLNHSLHGNRDKII